MTDTLEKTRTGPVAVRMDNIFEDLAIPNSQDELQKVRLAQAINKRLAHLAPTQALRGIALGVAQPIISNLERYELGGMSTRRLQRYATHLGLQVTVSLDIRWPFDDGAID